ncbi:MAG: hypothetical protein K5798_02775 [Nitrosopumilus sp.]|uniref:hypothetical protein n=1 Tax=Nitrosopumilus sp. TaxID=2024843 RepID=UPI00242A97D1|nr:hypothetical protein [Nitrosopumilus sp.]MCV0366174.1 hypothetical protein [Nitrosopumilus sp.]
MIALQCMILSTMLENMWNFKHIEMEFATIKQEISKITQSDLDTHGKIREIHSQIPLKIKENGH